MRCTRDASAVFSDGAARVYTGKVRTIVWLVVAGCGFGPELSSGTSDGRPADARAGAPADAHVFHDAPPGQDGPAVQGSLTVTTTILGNSDLDIATEGTLDWVHWGYTGIVGFDRKSGGTAISNLTTAPTVGFTGAPFTATWSGGTPHANVSQTSSGVGVHQGDTAMTFTVAAGTTSHTLRVYAGAQGSVHRLDVSLSDGSAPMVTKTLSATGTTNVRYTITFNAASAGQTLTVSVTDTADAGGGNSFSALLEATLQ
jgi:hypothetical protein